ncbi:MAG: REP-associated tyrosine transposase [Armatimonadota bacterium]
MTLSGNNRHPEFIEQFRKTQRRLPHWQAPGETHFLTFGLLDRTSCDLTLPALARTIVGALQFRHEETYLLHDWVLMPDHVHLMVTPMATEHGFHSLSRILGSIKGWTAHEINRSIGRRGALWQDETFDRVIRNDAEYRKRAYYIWMNPVEADLVADPRDWPWWGNGGFCRADL